MMAGLAWLVIKKYVGGLFGWALSLPWQVWAVVIGALALLYFGHWNAERGKAEVRQEVTQAVAKERELILAEDRKAVDAAERRAAAAELAAQERERIADEIIESMRKKGPDADRVCLPGDVTRRMRNLRR